MTDTKTKILDLAESLTQERGFGGFSYLDLADQIGIKSASIHYHFKSKNDLAAALVERTHEVHSKGFQDIEATIKSPKKRLESVIEYFQDYVVNRKFCMCGMMAAELNSASPRVSKLLDAYFIDFQAWLARQFKEAGHKDAKMKAIGFLSALEGSLLIARLRNEPKLVRDALRDYLKT